MNFIDRWLRNGAIKSYRKEMEQFVSNLQAMDSEELYCLMLGVMSARDDLILTAGIDVMEPFALVSVNPVICIEFSKIIRKIQSQKAYVAAAALMPWTHTLRAALYPELRGLARKMWGELERGMDDPTVDDFPEGFTPNPL